MDVDSEIYEDLPNVDHDLTAEVEKLQEQNNQLLEHIQSLESDIEKLCSKITEMKKVQNNLSKNISELFKTAKAEIERKDKTIADLRSQLDRYQSMQKVCLPVKRNRDFSPTLRKTSSDTAVKRVRADENRSKERKRKSRSRSRSRDRSKHHREKSREESRRDHHKMSHYEKHDMIHDKKSLIRKYSRKNEVKKKNDGVLNNVANIDVLATSEHEKNDIKPEAVVKNDVNTETTKTKMELKIKTNKKPNIEDVTMKLKQKIEEKSINNEELNISLYTDLNITNESEKSFGKNCLLTDLNLSESDEQKNCAEGNPIVGDKEQRSCTEGNSTVGDKEIIKENDLNTHLEIKMKGNDNNKRNYLEPKLEIIVESNKNKDIVTKTEVKQLNYCESRTTDFKGASSSELLKKIEENVLRKEKNPSGDEALKKKSECSKKHTAENTDFKSTSLVPRKEKEKTPSDEKTTKKMPESTMEDNNCKKDKTENIPVDSKTTSLEPLKIKENVQRKEEEKTPLADKPLKKIPESTKETIGNPKKKDTENNKDSKTTSLGPFKKFKESIPRKEKKRKISSGDKTIKKTPESTNEVSNCCKKDKTENILVDSKTTSLEPLKIKENSPKKEKIEKTVKKTPDPTKDGNDLKNDESEGSTTDSKATSLELQKKLKANISKQEKEKLPIGDNTNETCTKKKESEKAPSCSKKDKLEEEVPESDRVLRSASKRNIKREKSNDCISLKQDSPVKRCAASPLLNNFLNVNLSHDGEIPTLHILETESQSNKSVFDLNLNLHNSTVTSTPINTKIEHVPFFKDYVASLEQNHTDDNVSMVANKGSNSSFGSENLSSTSEQKSLNSSSVRKRRRVVITFID